MLWVGMMPFEADVLAAACRNDWAWLLLTLLLAAEAEEAVLDVDVLATAVVKLVELVSSCLAYLTIHGCFMTPSRDKRSLGFLRSNCDMRSTASGDIVAGHVYSTRVILRYVAS